MGTTRLHRTPLERYGFLHDVASRELRARRIAAVLRTFFCPDTSALEVLDIGCSAGLVTATLARHVAWIAGVDTDREAIDYAVTAHGEIKNVHFLAASGEALPFPGCIFDAVICNHIYEHVTDAPRLMGEIRRVLRPGGACYFAAGHMLQIIEPHYRLPLLSWLPRRVAGLYLRVTGRGSAYEETFLPPWRLHRLFTGFEEALFLTPHLLREPDLYAFDQGLLKWPIARWVLRRLARPVALLSPTQLWLLRMPKIGAAELRKGKCR
jgi:SAM-dependent methyltransferase